MQVQRNTVGIGYGFYVDAALIENSENFTRDLAPELVLLEHYSEYSEQMEYAVTVASSTVFFDPNDPTDKTSYVAPSFYDLLASEVLALKRLSDSFNYDWTPNTIIMVADTR